MTHTIKYDESKLIELMLYIGGKCALHEHYGAVKLNKILFYSDFTAYRTLGAPITGARYRKYVRGPAPAVMGPLKAKLIRRNVVFEYNHPSMGFDADGNQNMEKRLLPRREASLDGFKAAEIVIVDAFIQRFLPLTGADVSNRSHDHPAWKLSEMEAEIPYFTAFLSDAPVAPLSGRDLARAKAVATKYAKGKYTFTHAAA